MLSMRPCSTEVPRPRVIFHEKLVDRGENRGKLSAVPFLQAIDEVLSERPDLDIRKPEAGRGPAKGPLLSRQ